MPLVTIGDAGAGDWQGQALTTGIQVGGSLLSHLFSSGGGDGPTLAQLEAEREEAAASEQRRILLFVGLGVGALVVLAIFRPSPK